MILNYSELTLFGQNIKGREEKKRKADLKQSPPECH